MQCIPWRFLFRNRRLLFRNTVLLNIPNSLHFPTPWKSVRGFLKIGFYDQRLPTLKSVFNKLSKIFPAISLGYIVFFPLRLLQLRVLCFKESRPERGSENVSNSGFYQYRMHFLLRQNGLLIT